MLVGSLKQVQRLKAFVLIFVPVVIPFLPVRIKWLTLKAELKSLRKIRQV